jgi:hypothetical protein
MRNTGIPYRLWNYGPVVPQDWQPGREEQFPAGIVQYGPVFQKKVVLIIAHAAGGHACAGSGRL